MTLSDRATCCLRLAPVLAEPVGRGSRRCGCHVRRQHRPIVVGGAKVPVWGIPTRAFQSYVLGTHCDHRGFSVLLRRHR